MQEMTAFTWPMAVSLGYVVFGLALEHFGYEKQAFAVLGAGVLFTSVAAP